MLLKRKRSESELSGGSPAHPDPSMDSSMVTSPTTASQRHSASPSHLPSRTMKRFRDSRPSEEDVYQKTIERLVSAAKQMHSQRGSSAAPGAQFVPPPAPQQQRPPPPPPQQHHHHHQQTSLHSFWKLPTRAPVQSAAGAWDVASPPPSSPAAPPPIFDVAATGLRRGDGPSSSSSYDAPTRCEDCGRGLGGRGDADDAMMDVDVDDVDMDADPDAAGVATACAGCGKHVCSHCSIASIGQPKRCLICAGKNQQTQPQSQQAWAGWTTQPLVF